MDIIFFVFGVLYMWIVFLNIGGKFGVGIGGSIGLIGFVLGLGGGVVGVVLGVIFGGFIGSGVYDYVRERRDDIVRWEWLGVGNDGGDFDDGS